MVNKWIMQVAMEQSAIDINCNISDFLRNENIIVPIKIGIKAKKYYENPITCNLISYGNNIVASVKDEYMEIISEYINKFEFYYCFETPYIYLLNDKLLSMGQRVCFMAQYYLPNIEKLKNIKCGYELKILRQADFANLYKPEWSNALCANRKELDVLGVGAYENGKLIGLAGCSADCDTMWQIGVDVLPEYRRKGIASSLTSRLALEILKLNKVPFYCSAWSNIRSIKNAIKSGFIPAWLEMTVKPIEIVTNIIK